MKNEITYSAVGLALLGVGAWLLLKRNNPQGLKIMETTTNNSKMPRGYRNNNPLNIRISSDKWQGEIQPNTDGVFEQFETMAHGYRAAYIIIRNYIRKYGLNTVAGIITRWAPNNENNTTGYISSVCAQTGFIPGTIIDPNDASQMQDLVAAMSVVENGSLYPVPYNALIEGWNLYKQA